MTHDELKLIVQRLRNNAKVIETYLLVGFARDIDKLIDTKVYNKILDECKLPEA